jgi:hypothetical protein
LWWATTAQKTRATRPQRTGLPFYLRERLARAAQRLTGAGVWVEDKGHSLALHFRQAPDAAVATDRINEVLVDLDPSLRCFGGKLVVNVVCAEAPDKADSLAALMARADAHSALFVGDDVNDEVVFARHHRHWLCVRVGRDDPQSRPISSIAVPKWRAAGSYPADEIAGSHYGRSMTHEALARGAVPEMLPDPPLACFANSGGCSVQCVRTFARSKGGVAARVRLSLWTASGHGGQGPRPGDGHSSIDRQQPGEGAGGA